MKTIFIQQLFDQTKSLFNSLTQQKYNPKDRYKKQKRSSIQDKIIYINAREKVSLKKNSIKKKSIWTLFK